MAVELLFHCPMSVLSKDGNAILNAAEAHSKEINPRLPENFLKDSRATLARTVESDASHFSATATLGHVTKDRDAKLAIVEDFIIKAREAAKRAFRGEDVKLRSEFQMGVSKVGGAAGALERARIVATSCAKPENAGALAAKGWQAQDTETFNAAIKELDAAGVAHGDAKTSKLRNTDERNSAGNDLFDRLLTIQTAADLQWPESDPANRSIRAEFKLGVFPPRRGKRSDGEKPQPEQPAPAPEAAQPAAPAVPQPADANK